MVQNANDEDTGCLPAETMQVLCISLLEKTDRLVFHDSDHLVLTILAQKEAERCSREQNISQRLVVLQRVPELLEVDVLHGQRCHDLGERDVEVFAQVILQRCKEGQGRTSGLGEIERPLRSMGCVLCADLAVQLLYQAVRNSGLLAGVEAGCNGSCRLDLLLRRSLLLHDLRHGIGQSLDGQVGLLLAVV